MSIIGVKWQAKNLNENIWTFIELPNTAEIFTLKNLDCKEIFDIRLLAL